jgi:hypothetical protein
MKRDKICKWGQRSQRDFNSAARVLAVPLIMILKILPKLISRLDKIFESKRGNELAGTVELRRPRLLMPRPGYI